MTDFISSYQQQINAKTIVADSDQLIIVQKMQACFAEINHYCQQNDQFFLSDLLNFSATATAQVKGLYLWGGVGRGKTHLLDLFFDSLQTNKKLRVHFHHFMQQVHESIKQLDKMSEPLTKIAGKLAKQYKIICLDEMFVLDISDAMILSELLQQLSAQGVVLLFTSNTHPDDLYKDGLQRARFLPAIEFIKNFTQVVNLKGDNDYRLHTLEQTTLYQLKQKKHESAAIEQQMKQLFDTMAGTKLHQDRDDLIINYRRLPVKQWESGIVWFSFDMLCNTHRNSSDYLRIATFFHTVMISDIYAMNSNQDDVARRFINLIDIFYDRYINIIVTADVLPEQLYSGTRLAFEFKRTTSRLTEMQTAQYLAKSKRHKHELEADLEQHQVAPFDPTVEHDPTRFGDWVSNGRCSDF